MLPFSIFASVALLLSKVKVALSDTRRTDKQDRKKKSKKEEIKPPPQTCTSGSTPSFFAATLASACSFSRAA